MYNSPEYQESSFEVETVFYIFSRWTGYLNAIYVIMRFFIDPYIAWHMTRLIIEGLYQESAYLPGYGYGHDTEGLDKFEAIDNEFHDKNSKSR